MFDELQLTQLIPSPSTTLSGNKALSLKNSAGKVDENHVMVYRAEDIQNHDEISLTRGGLILIGILRGGDYDQTGLAGCGIAIAHGLARSGFGDELLEAAHTLSREDFEDYIPEWRERLRQEMRTNSKGFLPKKCPALAKSMSGDFPDIEVVLLYTNPITTESKGRTAREFHLDWEKEPDIGKIAALCEQHFEWGYKEMILKRFRTVLWPSAVLRILRRVALLTDKTNLPPVAYNSQAPPRTPQKKNNRSPIEIGSPSKLIARHFATMQLHSPSKSDDDKEEDDLIVKIHSSRTHASTDGILELRLEIAPATLANLAEGGLLGTRKKPVTGSGDPDDEESEAGSDDDGGSSTKFPDPGSHLRVWMPACMVRMAHPTMVEAFESMQTKKKDKRTGKVLGRKDRGKTTQSAKGGQSLSVDTQTYELEELPSGTERTAPLPSQNRPKVKQKVTKVTPQAKASQSLDHSVDQQRKIGDLLKTSKAAVATKAKPSGSTSSTSRVAALFNELDGLIDLSQSQEQNRSESTSSELSAPSLQNRNQSQDNQSQLVGPPDSFESGSLSPSRRGEKPFPSLFTTADNPFVDGSFRNTSKTSSGRRKAQSSLCSGQTQKAIWTHDSDSTSKTLPRKPDDSSFSHKISRIPVLRTQDVGSSDRTIIVISSDSESGAESDFSIVCSNNMPHDGNTTGIRSSLPRHRMTRPPTSGDDIIDLTEL